VLEIVWSQIGLCWRRVHSYDALGFAEAWTMRRACPLTLSRPVYERNLRAHRYFGHCLGVILPPGHARGRI
jgi:hypothetical protein